MTAGREKDEGVVDSPRGDDSKRGHSQKASTTDFTDGTDKNSSHSPSVKIREIRGEIYVHPVN
jgi:hypothetical protein